MPDVARPAVTVTEAGLTQSDGEVAKPLSDQGHCASNSVDGASNEATESELSDRYCKC